MNPIGIHFSYWTQEWSSEPIQFVKKAQKCGFDILEVNTPKITRMSKAERDALKGAADDAGLGSRANIQHWHDSRHGFGLRGRYNEEEGYFLSPRSIKSNEVDGWHDHGRDQLQLVAAEAVVRRGQRTSY